MKRKAPSSSIVGKHRPSIESISIPMIVSILLILSFVPGSMIHSFSLVVGGTELVRTKCTNSDFSTGVRSASRTIDHTVSSSSSSSSSSSLDEVPTVSPTSESIKDEQAVDEYLEFLDRRYRYVHVCVRWNCFTLLVWCDIPTFHH